MVDVFINKDRLVSPCHTMPPSEEGTKAVPFQRSLGAVFAHEAESRALREKPITRGRSRSRLVGLRGTLKMIPCRSAQSATIFSEHACKRAYAT